MENDRSDAFQGNGVPSLEWVRIKHLQAVVPQHVIFRPFSSEMVLLNIQTGKYHGMDEVGSRCFEALRASETIEAALETLREEYEGAEERIRGDLVGYCSELVAHGLIELRGSSR